MSDPLNHLGSIWNHSGPLEVPYSPNQFLGWDFFSVSYRKPALTLKTKQETRIEIDVWTNDQFQGYDLFPHRLNILKSKRSYLKRFPYCNRFIFSVNVEIFTKVFLIGFFHFFYTNQNSLQTNENKEFLASVTWELMREFSGFHQ